MLKWVTVGVVVLLAALAWAEDDAKEVPQVVSVSVETGPRKQPYFASFDTTPFVAYQWETGVVMGRPEAAPILRVYSEEDLMEHKKKVLLDHGVRLVQEGPQVIAEAAKKLKKLDLGDPKDILPNLKYFKEINPMTVGRFLEANLPFVVVALCRCSRDFEVVMHLPDLETLLDANPELQQKFSLLYAWPEAVNRFQLKSVFTLGENDIPAILIDNIPAGANNEKYRFPPLMESSRTEFDELDILQYLNDFLAGSLTMHIRSAIPPENDHRNDKGQIVDVVASTFDDLVLGDEKHVLLMIYSPWCGGSRAVLPVIEQIAELLKDEQDVRIARFDGTVNDLPYKGIHLTHYPSMFLFKNGQKLNDEGHLSPLDWDDYNGSKTPHHREVPHSHYEKENILKFLNENLNKAFTV